MSKFDVSRYKIMLTPFTDEDDELPVNIYLVNIIGKPVDIIVGADAIWETRFNLLIPLTLEYSYGESIKDVAGVIEVDWTIDSDGKFEDDFIAFLYRLQVRHDINIDPEGENDLFSMVMSKFVRAEVETLKGKKIPV